MKKGDTLVEKNYDKEYIIVDIDIEKGKGYNPCEPEFDYIYTLKDKHNWFSIPFKVTESEVRKNFEKKSKKKKSKEKKSKSGEYSDINAILQNAKDSRTGFSTGSGGNKKRKQKKTLRKQMRKKSRKSQKKRKM